MRLLQVFLYIIIIVVVSALMLYIYKLLQSIHKMIKSKENNQNIDSILNRVSNMIESAVMTTTNTYVKELKESSSFDVDAQKRAFEKTYVAVKNQLTIESIEVIQQVYGDLEIYLTNKIEQVVAESKR